MPTKEKLVFKQCAARPGYDYSYAERGGWVATINLVANFWHVQVRYYDENIYSGEFSFTEHRAAQAKCQELFEDFVHKNLIWEKEVTVSDGVKYIDYRHISAKKKCVYQIYHKENEEIFYGNILWRQNGSYRKTEDEKKFAELTAARLYFFNMEQAFPDEAAS